MWTLMVAAYTGLALMSVTLRSREQGPAPPFMTGTCCGRVWLSERDEVNNRMQRVGTVDFVIRVIIGRFRGVIASTARVQRVEIKIPTLEVQILHSRA